MKVGIVSDIYYPCPSGIASHVHYLAQSLRVQGHEVKLLTTHFGRTDASNADVTRVGRALPIPSNGSVFYVAFDLRLPFLVRNYLRAERFDLLWLMAIVPFNLSFWALHYSKALNIARFVSTGVGPRAFGASPVRSYSKRFLKTIHGLNVPSLSAMNNISRYIPGDYRIIPDAVDADRFNPAVVPASGFSVSGRQVLFVGRIEPRKGLSQLLAAFPLVMQAVPDAVLLVAGTGPLERQCRHLARELGIAHAVEFLGCVSDERLPSLYAACDVYCSPALGGESFGIVLLEAMAMGKAVVAADIRGYRLVVEDEQNGLLFSPGEPASLAGAIVRVLQDPVLKKRLEVNARKHALEYSWPVVARQVEGFCEDVFASNNRAWRRPEPRQGRTNGQGHQERPEERCDR
jgi:phosphatidylinositol alpha-mannosyltransferase